MDHLRKSGFTIEERNVVDVGVVKRKHSVPAALESCHTALVEGYVIEGHVPADVIDQLLRERPKVVGLAVPGMPLGSPGMEAAGQTPPPYEVIAFDLRGTRRVYARR